MIKANSIMHGVTNTKLVPISEADKVQYIYIGNKTKIMCISPKQEGTPLGFVLFEYINSMADEVENMIK